MPIRGRAGSLPLTILGSLAHCAGTRGALPAEPRWRNEVGLPCAAEGGELGWPTARASAVSRLPLACLGRRQLASFAVGSGGVMLPLRSCCLGRRKVGNWVGRLLEHRQSLGSRWLVLGAVNSPRSQSARAS